MADRGIRSRKGPIFRVCKNKSCGLRFEVKYPLQRCCGYFCEVAVQKSKKSFAESVVDRRVVRKVSKKQEEFIKDLSSVKVVIRSEREAKCESCGSVGGLDPSHCIPLSKRKDLGLLKEGIFLQCRQCHMAWEHMDVVRILQFKNLIKMMDFMFKYDKKRYWHMKDRLDNVLHMP